MRIFRSILAVLCRQLENYEAPVRVGFDTNRGIFTGEVPGYCKMSFSSRAFSGARQTGKPVLCAGVPGGLRFLRATGRFPSRAFDFHQPDRRAGLPPSPVWPPAFSSGHMALC